MTYIFIGIISLLVILIVTGKKSVHHEIFIKASPEKVWKVLMDMNEYDEWNPTMKLVDGKVSVGNKVTYQFTQDENNTSKIDATVKKLFRIGY